MSILPGWIMTFRIFKLAFLVLFLLIQCNTKHDDNSAAEILSPSTSTQTQNPLIGEWKYSNSIWYSSELTLQENGTFKFHDQGCYGQRFSQGQWTNNNGIIQLISFASFKQKEKTEANNSSEVIEKKKPKHTLQKGESKYSFAGFEDIPPPVLPGPGDTVRVYLDKVQLNLKNDTLYCAGSKKLPEEAKFYRTKSNR